MKVMTYQKVKNEKRDKSCNFYPFLSQLGYWKEAAWNSSRFETSFVQSDGIFHMSNDQKPGWLHYIGDNTTHLGPTYIGIIITHYKDPY